jgi:hypothetical protein
VYRILPALCLLALVATFGGSVQAAAPRVVLLAAPTEAKAGMSFPVTLGVRGTTARARVVAMSPAGTTSVAARRTGRTYRARVVLSQPGDWRLSARIGRRSFPLTTIDVRSPGATLVEPFRVVLAPDGSLVIPNGRGHDVLRLRDGRLERVAGNGRDGFEADGVAATSTAVGFPIDAAVAPNGERLRRDRASCTQGRCRDRHDLDVRRNGNGPLRRRRRPGEGCQPGRAGCRSRRA